MACLLSDMVIVFFKFSAETPTSISSKIVSGFSVLGLSEVKTAWLLDEFNEDILVLSGAVRGEVGQYILQDKLDQAEESLLKWKASFGDRFYIEVQRHEKDKREIEQERYIQQALYFAVNYDVPVVATHPIQYMGEDDFMAHEAKTCIADGYVLADKRRPKLFSSQQYFKDSKEMHVLFNDIPSALKNSFSKIKVQNQLGEIYLPDFPVPGSLKIEDFLLSEALSGLKKRLESLYINKVDYDEQFSRYNERLIFETNVINQMGYAGYFLIVADFISWSKKNKIPVGPGRGSGAGSVVAFSLGITDLDPYGFTF